MTKRVWVLMRGERGEGGSIQGIYAKKRKAFQAFDDAHKSHGYPRLMMEEDRESCSFEWGCDWFSISPIAMIV